MLEVKMLLTQHAVTAAARAGMAKLKRATESEVL